RRGYEQTSRLAQSTEQVAMFEEMLDFNGRVVSDRGKFGVQRLHDAHRVRGTVQKIRIAESHMACALRDLLADIVEHDVALNYAELALIHGHDGAVAAQMFAAAARLGV